MNQIANPAGIFTTPANFVQESTLPTPFDRPLSPAWQCLAWETENHTSTPAHGHFSSAQYAVWDGERFTVKDYITQREYTDQAYKPLIEHRFSHMDFWLGGGKIILVGFGTV